MMKYLSLFSGIGGFELGIQNSDVDMECIGFSEVDNYAKSIYRRHFPNHRDLGDATKINPKELPDFDLLVGGFPCQAFSYAGERRGLDDTRGTLFFEIARICQEKKPQYLLLENVPGLLSHDKGRTFSTFIGILTEMGYDLQWETRNSKNYGVAQNRERLFIKGYLGGRGRREILCFGGDSSEDTRQLQEVKFARQVTKRVYDVDVERLKVLLKESKKNSGLTNRQISEELMLPLTHVEHWFRSDSSFSIPNSNKWFELKNLLNIQTDEFDDSIIKFEVVEGVYDKSKRAYKEDGLSPTATAQGEIITLVPGKQATRIMSTEGVGVTLCGTAGGLGGKTGLYAIPKVVGNYSEKKHGGANVHDPNGVSPTLTATNYKHPVTIREDKKAIPTLTPERVNKRQNGRRMKEDGEPMFTLTAQDRHGVFDGYRFRRLTPLETERLQAFPDNWTKYGADGEEISDTQRYKCTGNAVTTTVITYIINEMFG